MSWATRVALLLAAYLTALGAAGSWDVAIGVLVAVLVAWATRPARRGRRWRPRHVPILARLAVRVVVQVARGAATMAAVLVGRASARHSGMVTVPSGARTRRGLVLTSLAVTASPGTAVVAEDDRRGRLHLHAIDARDAARITADVRRLQPRRRRRSRR